MDSNQAKQAFRSTPPTVFNNDEVIRIVMVGKTGVGKSATGNTILGEKCFKSETCLKPVTTVCGKAFGEVDKEWVAVIDTPGLFYTHDTEEKTVKELAQSISFALPGPHIFLIIIKLGRYTEEEKQTVQKIQETFGEEANKYSMVLFTHGDQLKGKPIEELLKESEDLQELVAKCKGHYHVFNNEEKDDRSQVSELLENIKKINKQNGGSYYTTEKFKDAERVIEEEKQRLLKEKKKENFKKEEELRKKIEKEYEKKFRDVVDDIERVTKLKEECEIETQKKMKNLRETQEYEARENAQISDQVLQLIIAIFPTLASFCISFFRRT